MNKLLKHSYRSGIDLRRNNFKLDIEGFSFSSKTKLKMASNPILLNAIIRESKHILRRYDRIDDTKIFVRRYKASLGVTPEITQVLWESLEGIEMKEKPNIKHLLWALLFLKVYSLEEVLSSMAETTEKTYRKWVWIIVNKLDELADKQVRKFSIFSVFGEPT